MSFLLLAACSPGGDSKGNTAPAPPAYSIVLEAPTQMATPENSGIVLAAVEGGVRISGTAPDGPATGRTQGATVELTPEQETAVSNKPVRVTIRARGVEGASQLRAAYATNDAGNSGWRELPVSAEMADVSFDYQVPAVRRGGGDFISILPPAAGALEVASIRVDVLPEGSIPPRPNAAQANQDAAKTN